MLRDLPPPTDQLGLDEGSSGRAGFSSDPVTSRRQYRDAYWATTFFALGSLLHLNQDMAQPQHTRIEAHPLGKRADYERYAEMRAKSDEVPAAFHSVFEGLLTWIPARPLTYSSANSVGTPILSNFSDYWSTASTGEVTTGRGLGDHSNARFFSSAHNLGQGRYTSPSNNPADYEQIQIADSSGDKHRYLKGKVTDPWTGSESSLLMTRLTPSAEARAARGWAPSQRVGNRLDYMLDARVYDDYLAHLIPLAVRYSAGLINHFFRGRLSITAPEDEVYGLVDHAVEYSSQGHGFAKLKAKVANAGAADNILAGLIVGVAKFRRNTCYDRDFASLRPDSGASAMTCRSAEEEISVSRPITISGVDRSPVQYTFEFSNKIPINAIDLRFQVVFRGQVGNEPDAVAVGGVDLYEPTFFSFQNDTDYISIGDDVYSKFALNAMGVPTLFKVIPQRCVIYEANKPARLSNVCFEDDSAASISYQIGRRPVTIEIRGLPIRQFARFAYLADSPTTTIRRAAGDCRWHDDSWTVHNVKWQVDYIDYVSGRVYNEYPTYARSRGVGGFLNTACLYWGDDIGPSTDKWWTQMTSLPDYLPPTPLSRLDF